jgi:ankyrin repeat protein
MLKKSVSIILASYLALGGILNQPLMEVSASYVNQTPTFSDVTSSSSRYEEIQSLKDRGIAEALIGNNFMQDSAMTREAAARMLVKAKGLSITDPSLNSITYKDISADDENLKYIQAATKAGIFTGYSNGTFKPKDSLNKAQMAAILTKAFGLTDTNSQMIITDMKPNHWAYKYVQSLWGITIGYTIPRVSFSNYETFKPNDPTTRGYMAFHVYRALKVAANDTLFEAIYKNDIDAVKSLLQSGVDPNGYVSVPTIKKYYSYDRSKSDMLMLYPAVMNKNHEMVQLLIDYGADAADSIYFTSTPLQLAIENGDTKLVELLLTNNINPNGYVYTNRYPYLVYAIEKNQTNIAKLLVQSGATPYKRFYSQEMASKGGYSTPYEYAVALNQTELVAYIRSESWKNDYQTKNVDLTKIKLPEREFQTDKEMEKFLTDNFSYLYTPVGKTTFSFWVGAWRDRSEFWIMTTFDEEFFDDVGEYAPSKFYDYSTREEVRRLLKGHQEKIGTVLGQINKNSQLYGGYQHLYMSIPEDPDPPKNRYYYSWKNYDENSTELYFRWFPLYDNKF